MPKIIVIGHLLLKLLRKCSHMFFGGHGVDKQYGYLCLQYSCLFTSQN